MDLSVFLGSLAALFRRLAWLRVGALGLCLAALAAGWVLAAAPVVNETVAIVDPYTPSQQAGVDSSGNLKVNCISGCSAGSGTGADNADGVAAVATGLGATVGYSYVWNGATWDRQPGSAGNGVTVNLKTVNGGALALGQTTMSASLPVAIASNQGNLPSNLAQIAGAATATGHGTATGALRVELPTDGTGLVGLAAGANTIGAVNLAAATTGGATPYHLSGGTAASTNATSVKASAGTLCDLAVINTTATLAYLKLYDSASAPTCSSATGLKHVYPVPANTSGAGFVRALAVGEAYAGGIAYCVTGGGADTDATNAPAGVFVEASYK
jgi:hypothetical protein